VTAYVVGIRPSDSTKPLPTVRITEGTSVVGSDVHAIAWAAAGHFVTGGGARTLPPDTSTSTETGFAEIAPLLLTGQLLTGSYPDFLSFQLLRGSDPYSFLVWYLPGLQPNIWRASSKDHIYSSKGRVRAFAVNVKFN
jgi:hypothetical protein